MGALPEVKEICIQFKSAFSYVNPKLVQELSPFSKTLLTEIHCFYSWNLRCCSQSHEEATKEDCNFVVPFQFSAFRGTLLLLMLLLLFS